MSLPLDIDTLRANPDIARLNPGLQAPEPPKRSKFGAVRTTYKGRVYDSKREAVRAQELDLAQAAGAVLAWFPQVRFPLSAGIVYVADFVVILADWTVVVEDVKGHRTKEYKLKRRLFRERYRREIVEIA